MIGTTGNPAGRPGLSFLAELGNLSVREVCSMKQEEICCCSKSIHLTTSTESTQMGVLKGLVMTQRLVIISLDYALISFEKKWTAQT